MAVMTGGEAITAGLKAHHVDTVFGLPGAQVYGLFDALHRAGLTVITPRHEQACGYMAFGQARATGRPAAYAVVPGPGVLNTSAALLTAASANEQVLCLTGQVPSSFLGKGRGHLHEMQDQRGTLAGIAKWAARADTASQAPQVVAEAFRQMASLRPGPAAVEMPWEQFVEVADCAPVGSLPLIPDPEPGDAVGQAAAMVARAEAPLVFVGSGAFEAQTEVLELAERIEAPVIAFRSGRGIVSQRHPLGLTVAEARHLWQMADLVIGIGTRMEMPSWRWPERAEVPRIRLDIDARELERTPTAYGVHGRARTSLRALLEEPALQKLPRKPAWLERVATARLVTAAECRSLTPHHEYLEAIRQVLPDDGILVDEICQAGFASWFAYPVYEPRSFISSGLQGTLGSGFPTALGVKVARPELPVVSISGDGGFMFAVQELATAAQYGIDVVAIVFNNSAFGNVRRDQMDRFGGRLVGSELQNPDFPGLAEAFGVRGASAGSPAKLRSTLEDALKSGKPWLIEVPITGEEANPWPLLRGN